MIDGSSSEVTLSVIIVTHNAELWIDALFRSLRQQTRRDFSVIVFDNASSDATLTKLQGCDFVAKVIANDVNLGFAAANNAAAKGARASHLFFLNPDTRLDRHAVEEIYKCIESNGDAIIAPLQRQYHSGEVLSQGNGVDWLGYPTMRGQTRRTFYADGAAMIVPSRLFERLGYFDEALFMFHEDIDFCWRAQLAGCSIVSCAEAVVYHVSGGSAVGGAWKGGTYRTSYFRRYHGEKNILRNILKNYSLWVLPMAIAAYLVQLGAEITLMMAFKRREFVAADIKAVKWNLRWLRDTLRMRRTVQRLRTVSDWTILQRMHCGFAKVGIFFAIGVPDVAPIRKTG